MPVLYLNFKKHECLKNEPYTSFFRKYSIIKDSLDGEHIELRVGGKDGDFSDGFYTDKIFYKNPRLKLEFAKLPPSAEEQASGIFIRAAYSYEGENSYDLDFHLQRVKDIKKRAPYYYIPGAAHFEFSSLIDDEYKLFFDVVVEEREKVQDVCCSLISLIIAVFSLDN